MQQCSYHSLLKIKESPTSAECHSSGMLHSSTWDVMKLNKYFQCSIIIKPILAYSLSCFAPNTSQISKAIINLWSSKFSLCQNTESVKGIGKNIFTLQKLLTVTNLSSFITSSMIPRCLKAFNRSSVDNCWCSGANSSRIVSARTSLILPWTSIWKRISLYATNTSSLYGSSYD